MDTKYKRGSRISRYGDLLKNDKLWIDIPSWKSHVRSIGYIKSLQFNTIYKFMISGLFYTVEQKENCAKEEEK